MVSASAPEDREATAPDDPGALCRACRLCCDGTIFATVSVTEEEVRRLRHRLTVLQSSDGSELYFEQGCTALGPSGCEVYADRPGRCSYFKCKLLMRHEAGEIPIAAALDMVARIREVVERLDRRLPPGKNHYRRVGLLPEPGVQTSKELAVIYGEAWLDVTVLEVLIKRDISDPANRKVEALMETAAVPEAR